MYNECKENNVKIDFRKEKYGFTVIFYRKNNYNDPVNSEYVPVNVPVSQENDPVNSEYVPVNVPVNKQEYKIYDKDLNKTERHILDEIKNNVNITQKELANILKLSEKTIKRNTNKLKEKHLLERIGADKNGYWKIIEK